MRREWERKTLKQVNIFGRKERKKRKKKVDLTNEDESLPLPAVAAVTIGLGSALPALLKGAIVIWYFVPHLKCSSKKELFFPVILTSSQLSEW